MRICNFIYDKTFSDTINVPYIFIVHSFFDHYTLSLSVQSIQTKSLIIKKKNKIFPQCCMKINLKLTHKAYTESFTWVVICMNIFIDHIKFIYKLIVIQLFNYSIFLYQIIININQHKKFRKFEDIHTPLMMT